MFKKILTLLVIALASVHLHAQLTTSSMSGNITGNNNEPLTGATIKAVHQPSGTAYSALTESNGHYNIRNMRVGGPYLVEISFVGFDKKSFNDIDLRLGEDYVLNVEMTNQNTTLSTVVVTAGRRNPILNSGRTGAVTNLSRREIEKLPSVTRNINDLTRITPQANGSSIAGGNYRQNNFTIDGADFNNSFGIGGNLPANGTPISLDALEEISVSITPFDVRQSGFIGSAINAVTRSGTNKFSGSAYRYWRSEKQQGDKVGKQTFVRTPFEFEQLGFRVGGPIIKNKLFFFMNFETENQPKQVQTNVAATAASGPGSFGSAPNIARPLASELDMISKYLADTYGYQTGPYDNYNTEIKREKIMGRIDWNISDKHRLNVRYSQVEGGDPNPPSTSTSGSGFSFPSGGGRRSIQHMWFKNSNYYQGANFYSAAAELNSRFGKFSNILRGTYTYQNDSRESDSQVFPLVDILKDGTAFATFGYEPFSFGNLRKVKMFSVVDNLSWTTGKHNFTVGGQFESSETINGFQRFGTSYYVFNSWDDFVNGAKPINFAQTFSLSPNFEQAFPSFRFAQFSLYGQDEIAVNNKFRLTLGLRADLPTYPDVTEIQTHPLVANLTFANGEKINTGELPETKILWSPRIGFNYDVVGDRSLQVRGGTGIFSGKVPFVWIVSQSGDAGMLQVTQGISGQSNTPGPFNPDPAAYRPATVPAAGTVIPGTISALAKDFQFPQTWKTSLGFDKKLGAGFILTMEGIYNKDLHTSVFRNANLKNPTPLAVSGYPDNRMIYPSTNNTRFVNPLNNQGQASPTGTQQLNTTVIDNGNKGHYMSLTVKLERQFAQGISGFLSYTKTVANNLFDGSGDQPLSAWQANETVNGANTPTLSQAGYVVPDRVTGGISIQKEYFKHLSTTISLFYNGSIDGRFSYVYGADFNRDGFNGNDLIYIPRNASEITFTPKTVNGVTYSAQQQSDMFFQYIEQDKYLSKRKGQYAERNGGEYPWRSQFDAKLLQDIFVNIGNNKNTLQFSIDIFNLGNLINSEWGKVKTLNTPALLVPTNANSLVPGGTVKPTFQLATDRNALVTETFRDNVSVTSTYYMQFGLRYIFN